MMNPWVLLGYLVGLIGIAMGAYTFGHRTEKAACERDANAVRAAAAIELSEWQAKARAQETAAQAATNRIAEAYEKGKTDATVTAETVVASLRDGSLKLRKQWAACESRAEVPKGGGTTSESDGAADLRSTDAGNLVRVTAECQAQVIGLQNYARQVSGISGR